MKIGLRHYLTLAFIVVATVPVLILGLWVEETSLEKELAAVSEKHLLLATNTTSALDLYARDAKKVFSLFAETVHQKPSPASLDLARTIGFRYVRLYEFDGRLVDQMTVDPDLGDPVSQEVFQKLYTISGVKPAISPLMTDGRGTPTLFVTKRLASGRLALAALRLDYIRKMQSAIAFGHKGHSAIVDQHGNVLAHPKHEWQDQITSLTKVKPVELMMQGKTGVLRFFSPATGQDMITGYSAAPETGWGVMVPQPLQELEERASDVHRAVGGLILIGLIASALLSWALAGLLVRPLQSVINAAQQFSRGYLDTRVQAIPEGYPTELQTLGCSFNTMVRDVSKGIVEREDAERDLQITHDHLGLVTRRLQSQNSQLENRVEARNADLRQEVDRRTELANALHLSNLRLKDFAESTSDWFWEMDENLRWSCFSETFMLTTGIPPENLLGKTFAESGIPDDDDRLQMAQLEALSAGRPFRNLKHHLTGAEGDAVYVSISANPVFDEAGRFTGYRGSGTNVTERHRLDRNKSAFITTISHELRTPLTSIHGSLGLLASGAIDQQTDEARSLLVIARNNSERLLAIVDDVLDLEKLERGNLAFDLRPFDLSALVSDSVDVNWQRARQKDVDLRLIDITPAIRVNGDPCRLARVMDNLISNALKFSSDGKSIEISLRCQGDWVRVSVADHGSGIAEAHRDHIFERFHMADTADNRQNGGLGLGLCMAKSIVEQQGGRIGFQSEVGVGSTFYFELPRLAD